jgi:hypothetical protein
MDRPTKEVLKIAAGLATGTGLVTASQAEAAIISGQFQTDGSAQISDSTTTPGESYSFDFNNDTVNDYSVKSSYSKSKPGKADGDKTKYYTYSGDTIAATSVDNAVTNAPFGFGEEIGPLAEYNQGGSVDAPYDNGNPSGYYGLRFGATAPYNYGWIQLREGNQPGAWDLVAYGYENTPDTPIAAGAVPEPTALATLALGAAGVALRRRHQPS